MKKMVIVLCIFFIAPTMTAQSGPKNSCLPGQLSLLIIDTDGHDQYYYRNLMLLAESVGFCVDYRNFYTFLETPQISSYDVVFFITSLGLFKNLQSPLIQKCIKAVQDYASTGNKTIGILIPGMPNFNETLYKLSLSLIESCGIFTHTKSGAHAIGQLRPYVSTQLRAVLKGDAHTAHIYGTTLINEQPEKVLHKASLSTHPFVVGNQIVAAPLPMYQQFCARACATLPAGLYVKNSITGNQYFIGKISEFTFADMPENFFKNPIHLTDRNELLRIAQQMLWEMHQAVTLKGMPLALDKPSLELPAQLSLSHMQAAKTKNQQAIKHRLRANKNYAWILNEGISCAWEAPDDYFLYDDASISHMEAQKAAEIKVKALDEGISFLYDAAINLVWFEFNAEAYLSDHARFKKDKQRFINQVRAIAGQLKRTAQQQKKPLPKVFIGTDITTNFATHPVCNQAQDIFGYTYSKIPSPLDLEKFWKPEVIEPFDLFCKTFGSQIPITGIFLDFEMYHAPEQASSYSDHMDFSHNTWQHCCRNLGDGSSCGLNSVAQRVDYLLHNQLFKDYFSHLEQEAALIGRALKDHLRALMPNLLIAAYLPTLPTSWFYRGILRGLSSKDEPVITATFNTDFYSHAQWLGDNNIHLIHGTPLLLSKIQCPENFNLIPKFLQYHDFVWYNRPSRMLYSNKKGKWWSTEASPLQAKSVAHGIKKATPLKK